jgi:hypothetical protein
MLIELSPKLLRLSSLKQNLVLQTFVNSGLRRLEIPYRHTIKMSTIPTFTTELKYHSALKKLPSHIDEFVVSFRLAENMSQSFEVLHSLNTLVPYVKVKVRILDCWDTEGSYDRQACIIALLCRFVDLGVHSVDLCDSLGEATRKSTARLLNIVLKNHFPLNIGLGVKSVNLALVGADMGVQSLLCSIVPAPNLPCVDTLEVAKALQLFLNYEDLHELKKMI